MTVAITFLTAIAAAAEPHYLDRYKPVAVWTLDPSPTAENLSDTSGKLKAKVHGDRKKGLPKLVGGARDFLGKAWDFNGVSTSFRSEATGRMQTLGDMENTKGISVSLWMKAPIERLQNHYRVFGHPAVEATMGQVSLPLQPGAARLPYRCFGKEQKSLRTHRGRLPEG